MKKNIRWTITLYLKNSYIFSPVAVYILISGLCAEFMRYAGSVFLQADAAGSAPLSYTYAAMAVWSCLCIVIPAGIGGLMIGKQAFMEAAAFSRDISGTQKKPPRVMAVLLTASVFLALGMNVLFFLLYSAGAADSSSLPVSLPGPAGILMQAVVYGLYMPLIEEALFRWILYARLKRAYGKMTGILVSAAFFGLYHGSLTQGCYAFVMGLTFAAAYEWTHMPQVPYALHGACNLAVLLLTWTGSWSRVCSPAWAAAFTAISAAGFLSIIPKQLKDKP